MAPTATGRGIPRDSRRWQIGFSRNAMIQARKKIRITSPMYSRATQLIYMARRARMKISSPTRMRRERWRCNESPETPTGHDAFFALHVGDANKEEETANSFRRTHEPILSWLGSTSVTPGMIADFAAIFD